MLGQTGLGQVVGDHLRAGGQRGLHPRLGLQALGDRVLGQQAGGDQDRRVRGVGARGDGRDDHVAVTDVEVFTLDGGAQLGVLGLAEFTRQRFGELGGGFGQQNAVLRTLGTGQRRLNGRQVELQGVREGRLGDAGLPPQALFLGVGLDQRDALGRAAGALQEGHGGGRDREEAAGRAVFRRHVGDGRLVFQGQVGQGVAVEFDELADHALLAQHLGDGQHQVGGRRAFRQGAGQLEADDFRDQHRDRLAQHRGLGLDAAHAPAQDRQAIDHGGVAVGADDGVGIGDFGAVDLVGPDRLSEILQVHLVADAGAGRHDAEVVERRRTPAQEAIALDVALVLALDVIVIGLGITEVVDHHRVVDDEVDRVQRVDLGRVGAQGDHGVAHGGQVDDGGNAGEVLHQHPRRAEADFVLDAALVLQPGRHGLEVVLVNRDAVLVAQQVLQKHLHRDRQRRSSGQTGFLGGAKAVIDVRLAADRKLAAGFEAVHRRHYGDSFSVHGRPKTTPGITR